MEGDAGDKPDACGVEDDRRGAIQAFKLELRIMRYELIDYEWAAIRTMLPNRPRGVSRVDDRRVLSSASDISDVPKVRST